MAMLVYTCNPGDGQWRQEDPGAWVPAAEPNPFTLGSGKDCFNFTK